MFRISKHQSSDSECLFCLDPLSYSKAKDLTYCSIDKGKEKGCGVCVHTKCQNGWEGGDVCGKCARKFVAGKIKEFKESEGILASEKEIEPIVVGVKTLDEEDDEEEEVEEEKEMSAKQNAI
jgi:hypothetical protein